MLLTQGSWGNEVRDRLIAHIEHKLTLPRLDEITDEAAHENEPRLAVPSVVTAACEPLNTHGN